MQVRIALRGKAEMLMGKNTMIRKALRGLAADNPDIAKLMNVVRGNVGFVFTKGDLAEIRDQLESFKVAAPARAGGIAPCEVTVPAGNTGMGPEKTQFFQALNIQTKITKGMQFAALGYHFYLCFSLAALCAYFRHVLSLSMFPILFALGRNVVPLGPCSAGSDFFSSSLLSYNMK